MTFALLKEVTLRRIGLGLLVVSALALATACSVPASDDASQRPLAAQPGAPKETARCDDGLPNGHETDVDCGGSCSARCSVGKGCKTDADCVSGVCGDGLCQSSISRNGVKDGDETDVDCGGLGAHACADGARCSVAGDCAGGSCDAGLCGQKAEDPEPPTVLDSPSLSTQNLNPLPIGNPDLVRIDPAVLQTVSQLVPSNAKSCKGTAGPGKNTCGAKGNESCCTTIQVPGGTYHRYRDPSLTATVSSFKLDKYEVTQGRMRAFFDATGGNVRAHAPAAGAGAHATVPGSGWRTDWNKRLPASWDEIDGRLVWGCAFGSDNASYGSTTWDDPANDDKPVTCIDWYTLYAFCIWDGGTLPTDTQWGYAAMGGSEERLYTWNNTAPHADAASYSRVVSYLDDWWMTWPPPPPEANQYWNEPDGALHIAPPGRKPAGKAKWGHMDLNGNVLEWMLDAGDVKTGPCTNCANTAYPALSPSENSPYPLNDDGSAAWASDGGRILRGGSFESHPLQNTHHYGNYPVWRTYARAGGRCARP